MTHKLYKLLLIPQNIHSTVQGVLPGLVGPGVLNKLDNKDMCDHCGGAIKQLLYRNQNIKGGTETSRSWLTVHHAFLVYF